MHTDKYGRTWRFKPNHDADCMVQVPWDVMAKFMQADRILLQGTGAETWMLQDFADGKPDGYILKLGGKLYTDARYSDEPSDYRSSCILTKAVFDAMVWHLYRRGPNRNAMAILDLIGRPEQPAQCW